MSGFARTSAQEQQREAANKQLDAAETSQNIQTGAAAGALLLFLLL
jgi:hypothetical protein